LVLPDFVKLRSLRGHRHAVALEVDVNALRAIRCALSRGFTSRAERAAAFDARSGKAVAPIVTGFRALMIGSNDE
jgi:hypothetical protein